MSLLTRLPLDALQKAVYGLLTRKMTTKTPIYDYVSAGTKWPYITFGRLDITPGGAKDADITICTMDLNIFSNYKGRAEINDIVEDVVNVLVGYKVKMTESGFVVLSKDCIGFVSDTIADIDGYVAILTFQFRIQNIKRMEETQSGTP